MLDIVWRCDKDNKVEYVWFDTGLEYQATKDHLVYLKNKYDINIIREKAIKPIPISCKIHGQPFLSKQVSENIMRLQSHNFSWEDGTFEELYIKYPRCKSALLWWCNAHDRKTNGQISSFDIGYNKYLKEFMIENPPTFNISNKCCQYAKKDVVHKLISKNKYDLDITGIRKAEGGVRATSYKNCFTTNGDSNKCDTYRPLFWFANKDKEEYKNAYGVEYSECYNTYGLSRTGCSGCPFGKNFEFELEVAEKYEPNLYKADCTIFKDSYEYDRQYREFVKRMKEKENRKE